MRVMVRVRQLQSLIKRLIPGWFITWGLLTAQSSAAAVDGNPTIKRFEVFRPTLLGGRSAALAGGANVQERWEMTAFGQTLRLRLQDNPQFAHLSPGQSGERRLLRGAIADKPTSWARLSFKDDTAEGLIWDGRELYGVTPAASAANMVSVPSDLPARGSIIFRLADTEVSLDADFCAARAPHELSSGDGLAEYAAMIDELGRMQIAAAGAAPTQGIELSVLTDAAFRGQYDTAEDAQDALLVRLNNLDGIYSAQVGLRMLVASIGSEGDVLTNSTSADTLLASLGTLRAGSPYLRATGITHLLTGRDLDGNTVGLGYIGSLCGPQYAVSLTESRTFGAVIDSMIMAHEIGHNLGAIHDDEGVCAGTPLTYLMAPQINGSTLEAFSQCSLDKFAATLPAAACVVPLTAADPQLSSDLGTVMAAPGSEFGLSIPVTNTGDLDAASVQLQVQFSGNLTILENEIDGGSCVGSDCTIDQLKAHETKSMNLRLSAPAIGTHTFTAALTADDDRNLNNNAGAGVIKLRPIADTRATVGSPNVLDTYVAGYLNVGIENLSSTDAASVSVNVTYPADVTVFSVELGDAVCTNGTLQTTCSLDSLAAMSQLQGRIHYSGAAAGAKTLRVTVSSDNFDPNGVDNTATANLQIRASASASTSSGGGGGPLDGGLLLLLAGMHGRRARRMFTARARSPANA